MTSAVYTTAAAALLALAPMTAVAEEVTSEIHLINSAGVGKAIGTIKAEDGPKGLWLHLDLTADLSPGPHGFHVHTNPSCDMAKKDGAMVAGLAAGGHYDPANTGKHLGPAGGGHLGDLPVLFVGIDEDGATATKHTLVRPGLKVADIRGHSFVIHAEGDNFSDEPKPLGGGGARVACGVIPG